MGDHFLEHLKLKSAELNPMAPLENRNDDLAIGFAHIWIDLEGAPKQSAQVAWAGLAATKHSNAWVGAMPPHCNQHVSHEKVFRICLVTRHDGDQVARIEFAKLTIIILPVVTQF